MGSGSGHNQASQMPHVAAARQVSSSSSRFPERRDNNLEKKRKMCPPRASPPIFNSGDFLQKIQREHAAKGRECAVLAFSPIPLSPSRAGQDEVYTGRHSREALEDFTVPGLTGATWSKPISSAPAVLISFLRATAAQCSSSRMPATTPSGPHGLRPISAPSLAPLRSPRRSELCSRRPAGSLQ